MGPTVSRYVYVGKSTGASDYAAREVASRLHQRDPSIRGSQSGRFSVDSHRFSCRFCSDSGFDFELSDGTKIVRKLNFTLTTPFAMSILQRFSARLQPLILVEISYEI